MQELVKIENREGKLVVSSRTISARLGKRHDNILRDLDLILENSNMSSLIISSFYEVDGQNRKYKEYLLTEKGFTLYMFNIQGYNDFKLSYINEFERMKNQIKVPTTFKEALKLALEQQEKLEQQEQLLIEQKPKVEFYDDVTGSDTTFDLGTVAKVLNKGIGRNKLFEFLRNKNILDRHNQPYQHFIDRGYFRLIESRYSKPNGDTKVTYKTVVYQKGVDYINKLLK